SAVADFVQVCFPSDGTSVQFNLLLHGDKRFSVPFDLGLPGLGLSLDGSGAVQVDLGWDLRLDFGVSIDPNVGVYFVTANPVDASNAPIPEVKMHVEVTTPNLSLGGQLGFLGVQATDGGNEVRTLTLGRPTGSGSLPDTFVLSYRPSAN